MRILFVTDRPAWPAIDGGRQRTALLLRALRTLGETDTFITFDPAQNGIENRVELYRRMGVVGHAVPLHRGELGAWRWIRPAAPKFVDRLAHNLGSLAWEYAPDPRVGPELSAVVTRKSYDLVVGRYLRPSAYAGALRCRPLAIDVDDLDTQVYRSRMLVPGQQAWKRVVLRHHLRQLEKIVPRVLAAADHLWVSAERDCDEIGSKKTSILPNIPFADDYAEAIHCPPAPAGGGEVVVMVASMTHRVNVEGVTRFLSECWPRIRAARPAAVFRLVGSGMSPELMDRWRGVAGVEVLGFVADLAPVYRQATLAVVPLFEGGGTKIKVLESFRHGRLAVVTDHAHRGYERSLSPESTAVVASSPEGLAEAVVRFLGEEGERNARALAGWRSVEEHFSWSGFRRAVHVGVERALAAGDHRSSS